ncbi:apolipoprotein L3-like [Hemiscyllium ocellatum]|uniref:apolipoprotein L3-like n=1 Tax=Hemiscyllium ocellatum TaxID=170820 RepID=UPI0029668D90|nr:apolipoprotein L3-like [Hemiscyllium ocellatum]
MEIYLKELRDIANSVDTCKRGVNIANIAGASANITGGLVAIGGLVASPFTFGASLALTGVGIGLGVAGGATNIGASISDHVIQNGKSNRIKEIIDLYKEASETMSESLRQAQGSIEVSIRMREETISRSSTIGATQVLSKSLNAVLVESSRVTGNALKAAKVVSGVLSGVLVVWDTYCLIKAAKDLREGSKTEFAREIRKAADAMEKEIEAYRKAYRKIMDAHF